jgi:acyl-coenzyme A thioesterase PaaI-like protein
MIVPFAKTIGIENSVLKNETKVQNHLGSIHAGAQFSFAEAASGKYLSSLFPDMQDDIIPLLRESSIKYKKQAFTQLTSEVFVDEVDLEKFITQYKSKGRSTIVADVVLKDEEGDVTCEGSFKWFVQSKN